MATKINISIPDFIGQKCERCGTDLSNRAKRTKYCFACSRAINNERQQARTAYLNELRDRDTIMHMTGTSSMCPKCQALALNTATFCWNCGQRLRECKHE